MTDAPRRRGRPAHVATDESRERVAEAAGMGMTNLQVADMMGLHVDTLVKYYPAELKKAKGEKNFKVVSTLFQIATDINHKSCDPAAMFWAKTQLGWHETNRTELTCPDGNPIQSETSTQTVDSRDLTQDQRDSLREILEKAIDKQGQYDKDTSDEEEFEANEG